jgi:hypothetical protein
MAGIRRKPTLLYQRDVICCVILTANSSAAVA